MMDSSTVMIQDPKTLQQTEAIYVAETGSALGRGAFAGRDFTPGEVVERAPVILLDYHIKELSLPVQRVVFNWSKLCDGPEKYALVLGFGSIYNHSDNPNLRYSADPNILGMIYTAVREIGKGEQLTISYNQVPEGAAPRARSWFEIHQVEKIDPAEHNRRGDPAGRPPRLHKETS